MHVGSDDCQKQYPVFGSLFDYSPSLLVGVSFAGKSGIGLRVLPHRGDRSIAVGLGPCDSCVMMVK